MPTQLSFLNDWRQLELRVGEDFHLNVLATFPDGSILEVTDSSLVAYRSSNPRVATIDRNGEIVSKGAGHAAVTATYTQGNRNVRVAVQIDVGTGLLR